MTENAKYRSLRVLFETGNIKKMSDLIDLYPSKIADDLKINYGRFINKLYKPEQFSVKEIIRFAQLIEVTPELIAAVVVANAAENMDIKKD